MAFFFNRGRTRQPSDVARTVKELLAKVEESPGIAKVEEDLAKQLSQVKLMVQGTQEVETSPEQVQALVQAVIQEDLLYELARGIRLLPFESRKDTQTIFSHILRFKPPQSTNADPPVISYIVHNRPEVIVELCRGYEFSQSAMPCGIILREALKFDVIAAIILYDQSAEGEPAIRLSDLQAGIVQSGEGVFWKFFGWIDRGSFEVSADAFTTFREILTRHKTLVSGYLATNFDLFFSRYNDILVQSDSYVTKRQSIKLLGEILLDRANYNVMTAYVDSGEHLKLCMKLLKDDRKMVQYEGFHVFKVCFDSIRGLWIMKSEGLTEECGQVFVANPNKSVAVQRILINNRDRLLKFLPKFLEDRTDDDQFTDEKSFLVRQIELLPKEPVAPGRPAGPAGSGANMAAVA
ncbi:conidiophore development protein hymA [Paecilomyces variotii No. 5]|uniref:Conidiophore development protein hymA n=1 Tax=Byssochlamys spectabilis (strain No. 5 / NBRC 109023) TaxID=1356009 RepID=V5HZ23_BYSSN|nr:conidiophore development protein hymA [Paecilomyces variotii No. 5]